MASKSAIGRGQAEALGRLAAAMQSIGALVNVPAVNLAEIHYRDPDYQNMARMQALAGWAEQVDAAFKAALAEAEPKPLDYSRLSVTDLRALVARRGLEVKSQRKADLVAALEAEG